MDCFKATLFDAYAETMSSVKVPIPVTVTSAEAHHSNFNLFVCAAVITLVLCAG
jgi:hypothetical protein